MVCSSSCVSGILIPQLGNICSVTTRDDCKSKLVLFRCNLSIPSGSEAAKAAALDAMITAKTLGATPKLKDFNWGDPQTTDFAFHDCAPAVPVVTQRELTGSDFNAIDVDDAGAASLYFDRDFWSGVTAGQYFNFGWTTCNGLLYLGAQDRNYTKFMTAVMTAFQAEDKSLPNKCMEVKKFILRFLGDPLKHFPKPYLDLSAQTGTYPNLLSLYQ
jgi:hypothetical protein